MLEFNLRKVQSPLINKQRKHGQKMETPRQLKKKQKKKNNRLQTQITAKNDTVRLRKFFETHIF